MPPISLHLQIAGRMRLADSPPRLRFPGFARVFVTGRVAFGTSREGSARTGWSVYRKSMIPRLALILAALAGSLLAGCGSNSGTVGVSGPANGACVDCGPTDLVVPNVVGQTLLDADRSLSDAHLLCRSSALVDGEPTGTIIAQDPKAGSKVRQYITVSVSYAVTKTTPPAIGNGCALRFATVP